MLTIGYNLFGGNYFDTRLYINNIYTAELKNGVFDEWKIDEIVGEYNTEKDEWGYDTVLLATFNNTLEAGNVQNEGKQIEYIRFKRRSKDKLRWTTFAQIPYDNIKKLYQVIDRLVQAQEDYEYAIVPVTANIEGRETMADILCEFDGVWLVDKNNSHQLLYNLEYGSIESVNKTAILEPLQSKYPFVTTSPINYKQSNVQAKLLSDKTIEQGTPNYKSERLLREKIMGFVNNKKPKILKDGMGRYYLVSIIGNPKEIPVNQLDGGVVDVAFDWVEIGDAHDTNTLERLDLITKGLVR